LAVITLIVWFFMVNLKGRFYRSGTVALKTVAVPASE